MSDVSGPHKKMPMLMVEVSGGQGTKHVLPCNALVKTSRSWFSRTSESQMSVTLPRNIYGQSGTFVPLSQSEV
jgi:hypothetical protein